MAGKFNNRFFVVSGMHRSGTTLTGKILALYPELHVIHEPLNREYGLKGVRHVYPCDMDLRQRSYYLELIERLLTGGVGYVRRVSNDNLAKAAGRAIIGGRTGLNMAMFRLRRITSPAVRPIFKDPFATLLTRSLIERRNRVLVLVRHPAAIWLSIQRMGWRFTYSDFAYPHIMADLGMAPPDIPIDQLSAVEKFAYLWAIIHSYLDRIVGTEGLLLVRHEDLCLKPYDELNRIEAFFGLAPCQAARDFIAKNMFAEVVTAENSQLHVFQRDSQSLATSWYGRLDAHDEDVIKRICGLLVERYYGVWQPM
jgi:hypothetical protein